MNQNGSLDVRFSIDPFVAAGVQQFWRPGGQRLNTNGFHVLCDLLAGAFTQPNRLLDAGDAFDKTGRWQPSITCRSRPGPASAYTRMATVGGAQPRGLQFAVPGRREAIRVGLVRLPAGSEDTPTRTAHIDYYFRITDIEVYDDPPGRHPSDPTIWTRDATVTSWVFEPPDDGTAYHIDTWRLASEPWSETWVGCLQTAPDREPTWQPGDARASLAAGAIPMALGATPEQVFYTLAQWVPSVDLGRHRPAHRLGD
jgi:hypothetical protein